MTLVRIDVIEGRRNPVQLEILADTVHAAIVRTLAIAARARHSLPAKLISELKTWLDGYAGNEHEPRLRSLLEAYAMRPGSV